MSNPYREKPTSARELAQNLRTIRKRGNPALSPSRFSESIVEEHGITQRFRVSLEVDFLRLDEESRDAIRQFLDDLSIQCTDPQFLAECRELLRPSAPDD